MIVRPEAGSVALASASKVVMFAGMIARGSWKKIARHIIFVESGMIVVTVNVLNPPPKWEHATQHTKCNTMTL